MTMSNKKLTYLSEKTEYTAIDFMKLVCAFLVMLVHIPFFTEQHSDLNFWITNVFCRLAVPLFFLASGFFLSQKIHDSKRVWNYVKRILLLYFIYSLLYAKQILELYFYNENGFDPNVIPNLLSFVNDFFFFGSYAHLWYLLALAVAVGLLYLFTSYFKWSDKKLLILTIILQFIGVWGNSYRNLLYGVPIINDIFTAYEKIFSTTRNGIFFGFPYITFGYLIYKYRDRIPKRNYCIYSLVFFALLNVEEYIAKQLTDHSGQSLIFTTPFISICIFLTMVFIRMPQIKPETGKFVRNLAFLIYVWHLFIRYYFGFVIFNMPLLPIGVSTYFRTAWRTILFGSVILLLSKKKQFAWLKSLY